MIDICYAPTFVRLYKGLPESLKEEVKEKIRLFRDEKNHPSLKVHKLKGCLRDSYSFSVNYRIRIVFEYGKGDLVYLLTVGDHDESYG